MGTHVQDAQFHLTAGGTDVALRCLSATLFLILSLELKLSQKVALMLDKGIIEARIQGCSKYTIKTLQDPISIYHAITHQAFLMSTSIADKSIPHIGISNFSDQI